MAQRLERRSSHSVALEQPGCDGIMLSQPGLIFLLLPSLPRNNPCLERLFLRNYSDLLRDLA
jgi:hypothetical protein